MLKLKVNEIEIEVEEGLTVLQSIMGLYEVDETSPYGGGPIRDVVVNSVEILTEPITN